MDRKHEKIFKRPDGTQYRIEVEIHVDYRDGVKFTHFVTVREKGKRKWLCVQTGDAWELRKLSHDEKIEHHGKELLKHVTAEEILNVKLELWKTIQPKL